jgi:uncharacterized damage-inducible protein DinB
MKLAELPWEEIVKDRGASFPSIRDIFLHALDVEDNKINYAIPGKSNERVSVHYDSFTDIISIEKRVKLIEKKVERYLKEITQVELDKRVLVPRKRASNLIMRVEDVLIHVVLEVVTHMGELIALLWQIDEDFPFLSWGSFLDQRGLLSKCSES